MSRKPFRRKRVQSGLLHDADPYEQYMTENFGSENNESGGFWDSAGNFIENPKTWSTIDSISQNLSNIFGGNRSGGRTTTVVQQPQSSFPTGLVVGGAAIVGTILLIGAIRKK